MRCGKGDSLFGARMEVSAIYEVYVDVYFIENVLLDMLVLWSAALLLGTKPVLWRLLLSAVLGGAGAVLILWIGSGYGAVYILSVLALDTLMCLLMFSNRRQVPVQVMYFHGLSFAYAKIAGCMAALGITRFVGVAAALLLAAAAAFLYGFKKKIGGKRLYTVRIVEGGRALDFKALFDTGNSLSDPYTGKPVSIVEESEDIRCWLRNKPQKYRIIPFRSIGRDNGILEGTEVDELIICRDDGQRVERDAVIALYRGKLSGDGAFQMILNRNIFI